MSIDWEQALPALRLVKVRGNGENEPVTIESTSEELSCIGIGTDAAVFHFAPTPKYAFKIYTELSLSKKDVEEEVYLRLEDSSYFPSFYGKGDSFIVISYEEGLTLYDCVLQGVHVPEQVMQDVEHARDYVRFRGLNPRDIHLKNVLLQDGRGKVLDVSEYINPGNDNRWEHLVWAYQHFYPFLRGRPIPSWLLEAIKQSYAKINKTTLSLGVFSRRVMRLFFKGRN